MVEDQKRSSTGPGTRGVAGTVGAGRHMARGFVIGRGSAAEVLGSGTLEQQLRKAVYKIAPRIASTVEKEALKLENYAQVRWPVGADRTLSGKLYTKRDRAENQPIRPHSKALFDYGLRIATNAIEGYVSNRAAYWYKIKSQKSGLNGKSASVELLRKPLRKRAPEIAKELAADIQALVRG